MHDILCAKYQRSISSFMSIMSGDIFWIMYAYITNVTWIYISNAPLSTEFFFIFGKYLSLRKQEKKNSNFFLCYSFD